MELHKKKCIPCEGGVPSLNKTMIDNLLPMISPLWQVKHGKMLMRQYDFVNFSQTMSFVNKVAEIAEQEGHHPDMHIHYSKCVIELWTHAIGGLSENDFILAAKIDRLNY